MYEYLLNVGGSEWVIIVFVGLILIFGTGKLPSVARKLGKAVNEYNTAKNSIQEQIREAETGMPRVSRITEPVVTERAKLEAMARSVGVSVGDKTDDDLRNTISKVMNPSDNNKKDKKSNTATTNTKFNEK